jgi:hypothetical protein
LQQPLRIPATGGHPAATEGNIQEALRPAAEHGVAGLAACFGRHGSSVLGCDARQACSGIKNFLPKGLEPQDTSQLTQAIILGMLFLRLSVTGVNVFARYRELLRLAEAAHQEMADALDALKVSELLLEQRVSIWSIPATPQPHATCPQKISQIVTFAYPAKVGEERRANTAFCLASERGICKQSTGNVLFCGAAAFQCRSPTSSKATQSEPEVVCLV